MGMTSRASPNPVMGSQQRRKTMTRSGQAFAEIVAKAKARAGPEEDEDSSPMASASMPRRRASAFASAPKPSGQDNLDLEWE